MGMNADIAAERPSKKRFEFTTCGPTAKISREAIQEISLIYAAAIAIRLLVKIWSRLETAGRLTPGSNLLFLAGGTLAAAAAIFFFSKMIRRRDYWPVFIAGALAFAAFFRFDKVPLGPGTALEKPMVFLPILPAAIATWAFFAMLRDADELERRINYQALGLAFTITFAACLAYSLLEDLGLPPISSFWWWFILAISWGVGLTVYSRRYQ
jgi:hypothetical protein